jgi:hypothetical protein
LTPEMLAVIDFLRELKTDQYTAAVNGFSQVAIFNRSEAGRGEVVFSFSKDSCPKGETGRDVLWEIKKGIKSFLAQKRKEVLEEINDSLSVAGKYEKKIHLLDSEFPLPD